MMPVKITGLKINSCFVKNNMEQLKVERMMQLTSRIHTNPRHSSYNMKVSSSVKMIFQPLQNYKDCIQHIVTINPVSMFQLFTY